MGPPIAADGGSRSKSRLAGALVAAAVLPASLQGRRIASGPKVSTPCGSANAEGFPGARHATHPVSYCPMV